MIVEQIAAAAEISPRTFFRYFPTKAALLIPDQLTAPVIELFLKAPAELSPIAAYRYAVEQMFADMDGPVWRDEMARQRLLYTLPEANGALYMTYIETIELITEALATRLDLPGDDPRLRITAGAMTGVMMAALHNTPIDPAAISRGLNFLDEGLPLTS